MSDTIPGDTSSTVVLSVNGSVSTSIEDNGDSDWFVADLLAGWGYHTWLEGLSSGQGTLEDPVLRLYDPQGGFLDGNDDNHETSGLDSYLYFEAPSDGGYYFAASAYDESLTGSYRIRLERDALASIGSAATVEADASTTATLGYPQDHADWSPISLEAGTTYLFDLAGSTGDGAGLQTLLDPWLGLRDAVGEMVVFDDNSGVGQNARILFTPTESGIYFLDAQAIDHTQGTYRQTVNAAPVVGALAIGGVANGAVEFAGEVDLYTVDLTAGVTYSIELNCVQLVNPFLELLDASGATLLSADNGSGLNSRATFTPTVSGIYYLAARESGNNATGTYALSITAAISGDAFELNNTASTATILGSIDGTVTHTDLSIGANDIDYFRFTLDGTSRAGDAVTLDFTHAQGDVDMVLYDNAAANVIGLSNSVDNQESISLAGLAAGTYLLQIYGRDGAANPAYTLTVSADPLEDGADVLEDNDTAATATLLGPVSGTVAREGLSVQPDDPDWFRFTLPGVGRDGDAVTVTASQALGDIDIGLYASDGVTLLGSSTGANDEERIDLAGLAAGDYLVRVYGYEGAGNPHYDIGISAAPYAAAADHFEQNDSVATATVLGVISGTRTEVHLSAEANDADYYRFTLAAPGRTTDYVAVDFSHVLGDVDIALATGAGTALLGISNTAGNRELISLAGLPAGDYLLVAGGLHGATNPDYSLTLHATPQTVPSDRFEENDSAQMATDLGTISGTRTEISLSMQASDPDWYRFTLAAAGRAGDAVTINFAQVAGDLDLELQDHNGNLLRSYGSGDSESISLSGLAAGEYLVHVFGYDGASNADYSLTLTTPPALAPDRYEDNDSAATATNLRGIVGTVTKDDLTVELNDDDWYRFTLNVAGQSADAATVTFSHAQGDVDLALYNAAGNTVLASSTSVGNQEQVNLAGLAAGEYLLRVYGYNGAPNPDYALSLAVAPAVVLADRFENNDTAATATDLRTIVGLVTEMELSVQANDADWYRFTLANSGRSGDSALLLFQHALGDVDFQLYNSTATSLLAQSTGSGDSEQIHFDGLGAGSYLLRVYGHHEAANPNYFLGLNVEPRAAVADRFENNDTANAATFLRTVVGTVTQPGLSIEAGDDDWFLFTLDDAGQAGNNAAISFNNAQGDLDLYLYSSSGAARLAASEGTGDQEQVSLAGLEAGSYMVRVAGYNGSANPDYTLTISAPAGLAADAWESNNSIATATVIRDAEQTISGATITPGDADFYRFTLPQMGAEADHLSLYTGTSNLQLELRDASGLILDTATSGYSGGAYLSLTGLVAGDYHARVSGNFPASKGEYGLDISATGITPGDWTVLVYINGDNDLEGAALEDINEMEVALNRAGVKVAVTLDRHPDYDTSEGNWTSSRRGIITHDNDTSDIGSYLISMPEQDMGDWQTLKGFINWGASNLPAENYMVVIWDHGGGALYGVSNDDTSGSAMSAAAVRAAIQESTLGFVDILGFDACLMAGVELASELDSVASVLIGSELTEPGDGWDYTAILNSLRGSSTVDALASTVVNSYFDFYDGQQTLSAISLADMVPLQSAINGFVMAMSSGTAADWRSVTSARARAATADADFSEYVDIVSFMREVKRISSHASLDSAAQTVIDAVENLVIRQGGPTAYHGLTIVFPKDPLPDDADGLFDNYTSDGYDFLTQTAWRTFLIQYLSRSLPASAAASEPGALDFAGSYSLDGEPLGFADDAFETPFQLESVNPPDYTVAATLDSAEAEADDLQYEPGPLDFAERYSLDGRPLAFGNDVIETPFQLGTVSQADYKITGLTIDFTTDADWYTFTLPAGAGYLPSAVVQVLGGVAGVRAQLMDGAGGLLAEATSSAAEGTLSFGQLAAGTTYLLNVTATEAIELPQYELHFDAFGAGAAAVALPDFAEAAGGNNAASKAWQLGTAAQLAQVGDVNNLSLDAADLLGGIEGGDWFRIDSARVTGSNASLVDVVNVSNDAGSLMLTVRALDGALIAQSSAPGDLSVAFARGVEDVLVQVQASGSQPVLSYGLRVVNDLSAPTVAGVVLTGATGAQNATLNAGDVITAAVTLSESAEVTGTPSLALDIGGTTVQASYVSGSGSNTLVFNYTVQAGDTDANGLSITADGLGLNGGRIIDVAGNTAVLSHSGVTDNPAFQVDTTSPEATSFNPAAGATDIDVESLVAVTFSETVQRGTGSIVLKTAAGATVETYDAADSPNLTISGSTLTVNPTSDLNYSTGYVLDFAAGSVQDLAGNSYAGTSSYHFSTEASDSIAPTVVITDNTPGVATGGVTYTFAFSEAVTGLDGSDFSVTNGTVTSISVSANNYSVVVAPTLGVEGLISLSLSGGAVEDLAGNPNAAAAAAMQAIDTKAPTAAASFDPADDAVNVSVASDLAIGFSEAIARGAGTITLKNLEGAVLETFDAAASSRLTVAGNTLTVDPTADLAYGTGYVLDFAAGSIQDLAGNGYAGGSGYNFTTTLVNPAVPKSAYYEIAQKFYVAYFGRAADAGGLENMAQMLADSNAPTNLLDLVQVGYASNQTVRDIIDSFGLSQESSNLYGGTDTTARVTAVYNFMFNRAPDADGLAYWVGNIDSGVLSLAKAALSIMQGSENWPLDDGLTVSKKVTVAQNFTSALDTPAESSSYAGDAAAAAVRSMLGAVGRTSDTGAYEPTVMATIATLMAAHPAPLVGRQTYFPEETHDWAAHVGLVGLGDFAG